MKVCFVLFDIICICLCDEWLGIWAIAAWLVKSRGSLATSQHPTGIVITTVYRYEKYPVNSPFLFDCTHIGTQLYLPVIVSDFL